MNGPKVPRKRQGKHGPAIAKGDDIKASLRKTEAKWDEKLKGKRYDKTK